MVFFQVLKLFASFLLSLKKIPWWNTTVWLQERLELYSEMLSSYRPIFISSHKLSIRVHYLAVFDHLKSSAGFFFFDRSFHLNLHVCNNSYDSGVKCCPQFKSPLAFIPIFQRIDFTNHCFYNQLRRCPKLSK